ncbi:terminase small subunit [Endozoicomonas arenosclerae]|uniref:terminase small subunit n=1 Tax=Endozoicomonas arenosclerae TaxID=1633495 RepID=UPI000ACDCAC6|nr:terminase small subunit [Endozoicomonas arenosclerae]
MNDKQRRFVDEYLTDLNATRAAIAAGYSEKTARSQGSRLLTNADISQAIQEQQETLSTELQITAQTKRKLLWDIATFCSQTVAGPDGEQRMRDPRSATSAIAELNKMDGAYSKTGNDIPQITFIQQFGDDCNGLKSQAFTVTDQIEE